MGTVIPYRLSVDLAPLPWPVVPPVKVTPGLFAGVYGGEDGYWSYRECYVLCFRLRWATFTPIRGTAR